MSFNLYLYEKIIAEHHAELKRDIEQSRMAAQARQEHRFAKYIVSRFDSLLAKRAPQHRRVKQSRAYFQRG
jgi:hypothetical protein